jgi:hypothetical protein
MLAIAVAVIAVCVGVIVGILALSSPMSEKNERHARPPGHGAKRAVVRPAPHSDVPDPSLNEPLAADELQAAEPDPEVLERKAEMDLRQAELLIENSRLNPARRRLKEVVEKYPHTAAAKKAKERLGHLDK